MGPGPLCPPGAQRLFSYFPLQMNQTTPDQERAPASEPVWERPWSVEEIRRSSQSWSLAADAGVRGGPRDGRGGRLIRGDAGGRMGLPINIDLTHLFLPSKTPRRQSPGTWAVVGRLSLAL